MYISTCERVGYRIGHIMCIRIFKVNRLEFLYVRLYIDVFNASKGIQSAFLKVLLVNKKYISRNSVKMSDF